MILVSQNHLIFKDWDEMQDGWIENEQLMSLLYDTCNTLLQSDRKRQLCYDQPSSTLMFTCCVKYNINILKERQLISCYCLPNPWREDKYQGVTTM